VRLLTRSPVFISNPFDGSEDALALVADPAFSLDRHPVAVYLAGLAPGSRRTQTAALRIIAMLFSADATEMTLPWWALDYAHTTAIRSKLAEKFAPATANRMLAAMRGVLKAAFKLGLVDSDRMKRACSVEPVRGSRVMKGRALSKGERAALFESCNPNKPGGARNAALVGLGYGAGLRRAEIVGLDLGDFDVETCDGEILIGATFLGTEAGTAVDEGTAPS
jgi:integrase